MPMFFITRARAEARKASARYPTIWNGAGTHSEFDGLQLLFCIVRARALDDHSAAVSPLLPDNDAARGGLDLSFSR